MINFIAVDFETANASKCSACSIGAIVVEESRITQKFYSLIKPHSGHDYFDFMNIKIHGIRKKDVEKAPEFSEVWSQVVPLIKKGNNTIVAHYASFDCSVISDTTTLYDLSMPDSITLCSCTVSKAAWPNLTSHSLSRVAEYRGIAFDHHHAQSDAEASAKIILDACKEYGCESLQELQRRLNVSFGRISKADTPYQGHHERVRRRSKFF